MFIQASAIILALMPCVVAAHELGVADLSDKEIEGYHQNLVLFEAYCGYREKPPSKCAIAATPSRLYINSSSIPIASILDVFSGSGHDRLVGDRFMEYSSGLKNARSEITGIYYRRINGSIGLAAVAFGSQQCGFNFNRTSQFVRMGGFIPLNKAVKTGPCGRSRGTNFDLEAHYN